MRCKFIFSFIDSNFSQLMNQIPSKTLLPLDKWLFFVYEVTKTLLPLDKWFFLVYEITEYTSANSKFLFYSILYNLPSYASCVSIFYWYL